MTVCGGGEKSGERMESKGTTPSKETSGEKLQKRITRRGKREGGYNPRRKLRGLGTKFNKTKE